MPVLIKICGITRVDDAMAAARCGADFVGLNFYPCSPRFVSEKQAQTILHALPASVTPVALFVNEPWDHIHAVAMRLDIKTVQIHGDRLEPCPFAGLNWMPAFAVHDSNSFAKVIAFLECCPGERKPTAILVDAHVSGKFGGTGQVAPWTQIANYHFGVPLMLAGGLTPENVADALRTVRPWGVDVASGVEASPAIKDHDKLRRFIAHVRDV